MKELADHLVVVPIVLPLVAAAVTLLVDERRRDIRAAISFSTTGGGQ